MNYLTIISFIFLLYVLFSKVGIITTQENIKNKFIVITLIYVIITIISFITVKIKFNKSFDKE